MPQMSRIEYEKQIVERMIRIYCKAKHKRKTLCKDCEDLRNFTHNKLTNCPFGNAKKVCADCHVHCYKNTVQREKIREIMRFAGPRMLFHHPKDFIRHWILK